MGPDGFPGEESFQFIVCMPRHLARQIEVEGIIFGRSFTIVKTVDISLILAGIRSKIERIQASSWLEIVRKISHFGSYEFEDFAIERLVKSVGV